MKRRRITETEKVKRFRIDKRILKRLEVDINRDFGSFSENIKIRSPEELTFVERKVIPKEPNPNRFWLWHYPLTIIIYLDTGKGFICDSRDNLLGWFEEHDLKKLYSRIGLYFLKKKRPKGIV